MMRELEIASLFLGLAATSLGAQLTESCAYQAERRVSVPASAGAVLRIQAGSGELSVRGRDGLGEVTVVARACASRQDDLEDLQVTLERVGQALDLITHYPEQRSLFGLRFGDNYYARLDLSVEVPLAMAADIEDGSGSMDVSGTGDLRIRDSSGEVRVSDIRGALDIDDSSGEIEVLGASGRVTIRDSSGEIRVEDAVGPVDIDDDSGEIDLRGVQGDVRLRDGSGSIDARQLRGNLTVEADGSGDIQVDQVSGDFAVLADGSGSIRYTGVAGRVNVPVRRGRRGG